MIPVTISEKAFSNIQAILETKNIPKEYGLRLIVQGGTGCSGVNFRLGFDKKKEEDESYFLENPSDRDKKIEVIYQKKDMMFLIGLEIDFEERTDEQGFVFQSKPLEKETTK
ncbi:HesB/IscA family protein [Bernardetia sp.]|uniref:HesB/IscA family protein n=1 Tax=Bernardetia sp. TaxID=1937974 RepID=UPI0025BB6796|nr:iron-sulfur cluster biosynthesis family protein [Bernardetia sp.]